MTANWRRCRDNPALHLDRHPAQGQHSSVIITRERPRAWCRHRSGPAGHPGARRAVLLVLAAALTTTAVSACGGHGYGGGSKPKPSSSSTKGGY